MPKYIITRSRGDSAQLERMCPYNLIVALPCYFCQAQTLSIYRSNALTKTILCHEIRIPMAQSDLFLLQRGWKRLLQLLCLGLVRSYNITLYVEMEIAIDPLFPVDPQPGPMWALHPFSPWAQLGLGPFGPQAQLGLGPFGPWAHLALGSIWARAPFGPGRIWARLKSFIWGNLKTCTWCASLLKSRCR